MKKTNLKKLAAIFCTAVMLSLTAGCSSGDNDETSAATSEPTDTEQSSESFYYEDEEAVVTSRGLEEGDDYAINKINPKTEGETLAGGYVLQDYNEINQGKLYNTDKSQVVIRAYNYNEDLQDMAVWADNACAMIVLANITRACDTVFGDPENVKVCGYDGIKYDYDIIQCDFIKDENDPDAEPVKTELYRYKARAYYFFSEDDAYAITFDTREENWEEQVKNLEEFVADLEVTKVEY